MVAYVYDANQRAPPIILALVVIGFNAFTLVGHALLPREWNHYLEAARFTVFPALDRLPRLIHWNVAMVASCCGLIGYLSILLARKNRILLVVFSLNVLVFAWTAIVDCVSSTCLMDSSVATLADQVEAVSNFNRASCVAWCNGLDSSVAASGKCPPDDDTIVGSVFGTSEWCRQALARVVFNETANYGGRSRFDEFTTAPCVAFVRGWCRVLAAFPAFLCLIFAHVLLFATAGSHQPVAIGNSDQDKFDDMDSIKKARVGEALNCPSVQIGLVNSYGAE